MESESDDQVVYDAHINEKVIQKGKDNKRIWNSMMLVVIKRFQAIIANRFRIDTKNIHFLSDKKYFSPEFNKSKPGPHLLMPDWDPNTHEEYVESIKGLKKQTEVKLPDLNGK